MRYLVQGNVTMYDAVVDSAASVVVYVSGTGALATIYSVSAGGSPIPGSVVSCLANGFFGFWLDDAVYPIPTLLKLVVLRDGISAREYDHVWAPALLTLVV